MHGLLGMLHRMLHLECAVYDGVILVGILGPAPDSRKTNSSRSGQSYLDII